MILLKKDESFIVVNGRMQTLTLYTPNKRFLYHISSAEKGFGEQINSYKTPRGWHYIRVSIGESNPINSYYKSRRLSKIKSDICGRILWLKGLELGKNHLNNHHSMKRYIYIHGTQKQFLKQPISYGCINMSNKDIAQLSNKIPKYCKVLILDSQ